MKCYTNCNGGADKPKYHVVSFSGGKDSTALLLYMLELGMPVDEILFCDTGAEFPQMYDHIRKVEEYIGRKVTILRADHDFEYFLFDYMPKFHRSKKENLHDKGLSWPSARIRWCTRRLKANVIDKHLKELSEKYELVQYVGIAYDEQHRAKKLNYPLIDWKWTEKDCLNYCREKGFDWGGLYDVFDRVSCWCCPLSKLEYLRRLRKHFPDLWKKLQDWQKKTWRDFRPNTPVDKLEVRFAYEDELGSTPKSRAFFSEVNRRYKKGLTENA